MIFWFTYALLFLFAAWFFLISAYAYWRAERPRKTRAARRPQPSPDLENRLTSLEVQYFLAPDVAINEARALYTEARGSPPADSLLFDEILRALEALSPQATRRIH